MGRLPSILSALFLFLHAFLIHAHPQCMNSRPPHTSSIPHTLCEDHSNYTCCTTQYDIHLRRTYDSLYDINSDTNISQHCYEVLKQMLCLRCHPYAAHVFDAEVPDTNATFVKFRVKFPGLCYDECVNMFPQCKDLLVQIPASAQFREFMRNSTTEEFCRWAEIPDKAYCYPLVNIITKSPPSSDSHNNADDVQLCVEANGESFANGLVAVHANDSTHRLFVGEQSGLVHVLDHNGRRLPQPFLNIQDRVINSGSPWDERGFLGLTFHPRYKENGHFYVFYSAPTKKVKRGNMSRYDWYWKVTHTIRVSEFTVDPNNPNMADHDSEMILLQVDQPAPNHNGGMIFFAGDNYLYISLGDGGGAGDPWQTGLNLNTLLGKMLRVDVDAPDKLYGIPPDNPFVGRADAKPEIFAYGARNMWRCSVDKGDVEKMGAGVGSGITGAKERIFCGDVGQSRFEEIDIIKNGGNYGWSAYEGPSCYNETACRMHLPNLTFPIISYNHTQGQSIVGGYVYRGCSVPTLFGRYVFGDTVNGRLFVATETNGTWVTKGVVMGNNSVCTGRLTNKYAKNILTFGETESKELIFLSSVWPDPHRPITYMYKLLDPKLTGDPDVCTINVIPPEKLGNITRRGVYKKFMIGRKKEPCEDKNPIFCRQYFGKGRKKKGWNCSRWIWVKKFCRRTCNICS